MSKTKQPIKFIYVTKFDSDNLTFTTKRLNVIKECSKYVSLDDGSRIEANNIYDLYSDNYCRNVENVLSRKESIYSLKPISKELKTRVKKEVIESLKLDIERNKRWIDSKESYIKSYKNSIIEEELNVKSLKDKVIEQEAKLDKLLKL